MGLSSEKRRRSCDDQVLMLTRFHDFQTRLGAVLEAYEMELDRMLTEL